MIKVILNGCCGKMGAAITNCAKDFPAIKIIAGIDKFPKENWPYKVFNSINEVDVDYDVLLDFSRADSLNDLIALTEKTNKSLVICSTGFSDEQLKYIDDSSKTLKLFRSANMSIGINLLAAVLRKVSPILYNNFDIEIVEKHHNQKVDSPSGTALLLADAIKDSLTDDITYVNGREGHAKREKQEIGIHAIRGGNIVGDHDVLFAGSGEVIEFNHKAISRDVFATGALKACEYMASVKDAGLYNMEDVLNLKTF